MPLLDAGVSSSPASQGAAGSRTLDTPPPMPPRQRRPGSVLFTPPMDSGSDSGMNAMGGDPMIQTMIASKAVDMAFQKLATLYPQAIDPLAQLQQSFRQLVAGLTMMQTQGGGMGGGMGMNNGMGGPGMPGMQSSPMGGLGAPPVVPPLPMQSAPTSGQQMGPGL